MSAEFWPARCSISECARLVNAAGIKVDRSNVSRLANKWKLVGDDKHVDPKAFANRYRTDFTRAVMAGDPSPPPTVPETPAAPAPTPAPATPDRSAIDVLDPKRRLADINARTAELELAEKLGETIPLAEAKAATAVALIAMNAGFQKATKDAASRMLADLHLSADKLPLIVAGLKRFADRARDAFADAAAKEYAPDDTSGTRERAMLDALVAHYEHLTAAGDAVAADIRETELAG